MEREQTNKLDQNSEDEVHEGPGPPTRPSPPDTSAENQIYQWVEGLRDDIDEILEAYNASDAQEGANLLDFEVSEVENWTVSKICNELKNGRFKNIVVFTGAGISTASGIPGKLGCKIFKEFFIGIKISFQIFEPQELDFMTISRHMI